MGVENNVVNDMILIAHSLLLPSGANDTHLGQDMGAMQNSAQTSRGYAEGSTLRAGHTMTFPARSLHDVPGPNQPHPNTSPHDALQSTYCSILPVEQHASCGGGLGSPGPELLLGHPFDLKGTSLFAAGTVTGVRPSSNSAPSPARRYTSSGQYGFGAISAGRGGNGELSPPPVSAVVAGVAADGDGHRGQPMVSNGRVGCRSRSIRQGEQHEDASFSLCIAACYAQQQQQLGEGFSCAACLGAVEQLASHLSCSHGLDPGSPGQTCNTSQCRVATFFRVVGMQNHWMPAAPSIAAEAPVHSCCTALFVKSSQSDAIIFQAILRNSKYQTVHVLAYSGCFNKAINTSLFP
jgi:hypothetical protein